MGDAFMDVLRDSLQAEYQIRWRRRIYVFGRLFFERKAF
jgi:hypothetical protein